MNSNSYSFSEHVTKPDVRCMGQFTLTQFLQQTQVTIGALSSVNPIRHMYVIFARLDVHNFLFMPNGSPMVIQPIRCSTISGIIWCVALDNCFRVNYTDVASFKR